MKTRKNVFYIVECTGSEGTSSHYSLREAKARFKKMWVEHQLNVCSGFKKPGKLSIIQVTETITTKTKVIAKE